MRVERVGKGKTNFPWAIVEEGSAQWNTPDRISQARFESKEAAQIAYRNYTMRREN